jgi:uncharacterized protein
MLMSDFTLHSLGVILHRLGHRAVFTLFVQDVLIDGGVALIGLPSTGMGQVVAVMDRFGLDFDDGYQYTVAEREHATIVSFDTHFDQTDRGRLTPAQAVRPNKRSHPTPLRVDKIRAILASRCARTISRSMVRRQLKRNTFGRSNQHPCHTKP